MQSFVLLSELTRFFDGRSACGSGSLHDRRVSVSPEFDDNSSRRSSNMTSTGTHPDGLAQLDANELGIDAEELWLAAGPAGGR